MSGKQNQRKGAAWQTEFPAFGNPALRQAWAARAAAIVKLEQAVQALVAWREAHASASVRDKDELWIEARLEERVAVLRFDELSHAEIRTRALTGEAVAALQESFESRAAAADASELERLAAEWRLRYKPPILPSSPFLKTEVRLSELLMKRRSLNWYGTSLRELRERRGVIVHRTGLPGSS
jgi:methane monooxygenase component A gamma chain